MVTSAVFSPDTRVGRWFVHGPAPVGERDGVPLWRCTCLIVGIRRSVTEAGGLLHRTLTESEIRATSAGFGRHLWGWECECPRAWPDDFAGWGWQTWTVLAYAGHRRRPDRPRQLVASWLCRCRCGVEQVFTELEMARWPFCPCQPPDSKAARQEAARLFGAVAAIRRRYQQSFREQRRAELDRDWTKPMARLLRQLQPACVLCGATERLHTDHVYPASIGEGLRPGNAVRLCAACNQEKGGLHPRRMVWKKGKVIQKAAQQFEKAWAVEAARRGLPWSPPETTVQAKPDARHRFSQPDGRFGSRVRLKVAESLEADDPAALWAVVLARAGVADSGGWTLVSCRPAVLDAAVVAVAKAAGVAPRRVTKYPQQRLVPWKAMPVSGLAVVGGKVDRGPLAPRKDVDAVAGPAREWAVVGRFDADGNAVSQTWAAMERPGRGRAVADRLAADFVRVDAVS